MSYPDPDFYRYPNPDRYTTVGRILLGIALVVVALLLLAIFTN